MLAKTFSATIIGVNAISVEIEINATGVGEKAIVSIVGLPDAAVKESRERVRSALTACGYLHPYGFTTVSLAPADLKKEGAAFDLPIAVGMIAAVNQLDRNAIADKALIGELALDGRVRPIQGALPVALHAKYAGMKCLLLPKANATEAGIVQGVDVIGVETLAEAINFLKGKIRILPTQVNAKSFYNGEVNPTCDFADIKGQDLVRRAAEVAAAGGHNLLMIGPPGTGKTLIAQRLPSILPWMNLDEALETTKIHSISGNLKSNKPLVVERPFRAPHHTISDAGLLGGQSTPKPGEVSLAHNGVLFLDELPEFKRSVLEVLRQPLESGEVTISRAAGSCTFPANVQLVAAMNPCPCGHYGSFQHECRCSTPQIERYRARISGPLLDRIDIHIEVAPLEEKELMARPNGEGSKGIRERVRKARIIQYQRFSKSRSTCNAKMNPKEIQDHCALDNSGQQLLKLAINELNLSARAYDRILRVARTIADLEGMRDIAENHISEAIQYRTLDRRLW